MLKKAIAIAFSILLANSGMVFHGNESEHGLSIEGNRRHNCEAAGALRPFSPLQHVSSLHHFLGLSNNEM